MVLKILSGHVVYNDVCKATCPLQGRGGYKTQEQTEFILSNIIFIHQGMQERQCIKNNLKYSGKARKDTQSKKL